jgi:hypothetical protein
VGKQGKTATNKDNNIRKLIDLHYCRFSPNIACFCKLMAQKRYKNLPLVVLISGVTFYTLNIRAGRKLY